MNTDFYNNELSSLDEKGLKRKILNIEQCGRFIICDNKKMVNLSSNDYLGISANYDIKDNFLSSYKGKIQNPSARLLTGSNKIYFELEELLKKLFNKKSSLLFNSGYHANVGIYSSLLTPNDVIFLDKLNHASIIDGVKLSGAKIIPFNHLDYDDLEEKLIKYRNKFKNSIISTESLFSMDGDFADIKTLSLLKEKYNSLLIVDEAHSFGVYGKGRGYCFELNLSDNVDLIMGTFGKAVGSYGAFVVGDKILINYLINKARSFIFSTALPEISVAFSKYVLENYILENTLQENLFNITKYSLSKIKTTSSSYIIPYIIGENDETYNVSKLLQNEGFFVLPIRYPTVKKGTSRIRLSLNPLIEKNEIDKLSKILEKI